MVTSNTTHIEYADTRRFSKLVLDYLSDHENLRPFYTHRPNKEGIEKAITTRQIVGTDRKMLVDKWMKEYQNLPKENAVLNNIKHIGEEITFTICTAHQPNIFSGPAYFIYKIQHAIKMAEEMKSHFPHLHFVPVYYMGSEDADLDEIGRVFFQGRWFIWDTNQTGAVGRMLVDQRFLNIMDEMEKTLGDDVSGKEVMSLFRRHYQLGVTISTATFGLVHEMFGAQGLLILNPDDSVCKKACVDVFKSDLFEHIPNEKVSDTIADFPEGYSIQTKGRAVNLFYLIDGIRSRIERHDDRFEVIGTNLRFSKDEMLEMLETHPERFSPNVILRPLLQERILPNIAFIGGGSELAYWMELKKLFIHFDTPFPVLILRNSFSIVSSDFFLAVNRFNIKVSDLFKDANKLDLVLLKANDIELPNIEAEIESLNHLYQSIQSRAIQSEKTLANHVDALRHKAEKRLLQLEKKMIRSEKKKHASLFLEVKKIQ
ncbi:MAG: bacillithiol biosynthesis cysteine-adding enzyme BshC, partial [Bacteroidota bacterium]